MACARPHRRRGCECGLLTAPERAAAAFERRYGERPLWVAAAPGRVNLIGEHTDYNDGFVLPMAIEREVAVAASPVAGDVATIASAAFDDTVTIDLGRPLMPGERHWSSYVAGVIAGVQARGDRVPAFHASIESDVPLGGGLSSSAALEVATLTFLEALTGTRSDPREAARLCQRAEHEFAGVPTGIMDQLVAVLAQPGRALRIDCRSLDAVHVDVSDAAVTVLIVNTNVRHVLSDGEYARRRAECAEAARVLGVRSLREASLATIEEAGGRLTTGLAARARHVITENRRVEAAVEAIERRDWSAVGRLMYASHASLRDDYAVSCRELDVLVDAASEAGDAGGLFGCRMTGGGFGGSVVCLARADRAEAVRDRLLAAYVARTGRKASALFTKAAAGARLIG